LVKLSQVFFFQIFIRSRTRKKICSKFYSDCRRCKGLHIADGELK